MRDPDADRELFRRDHSNSDDGTFRLFTSPPGAYTLVAIDGGWSLNRTRPEVLAHYLPQWVKVNITASQQNITVPNRSRSKSASIKGVFLEPTYGLY